jgi:hypothetical protein
VDDPILGRISHQAGIPDLVEALGSRIAPTDLQSLLLEVARVRSARRSPGDLLRHHIRDRTVMPAAADGRVLARLATMSLDLAPEFEAIELSPVEPLGLNTVLGQIDQNNVLATVRGSEVVADPTAPLALEAAVRRRAGTPRVRLCTCCRVLRLQPFDSSRFLQHFSLFALVTAGRSEPNNGFEVSAIGEHVAAHLRVITAARALGGAIGEAVVRLSDTQLRASLQMRAVAPKPDVERARDAMPDADADALASRMRRLDRAMDALGPTVGGFAGARVLVDLTRAHAVSYYRGLQMSIDAELDGEMVNVADGGSVDWAGRLLSNRREQLFTSGVGLERLAASVPGLAT